MNQEQRSKIAGGRGFLAALDQSGGSTPKALALYGVPESSYATEGEMFDLIVEIQKRLFALIEEQMSGVPGVKEAKAAMALMPDLRQMKDVVQAMQGVVTSGGSALHATRSARTGR